MRPERPETIVLFDGYCVICNAGIDMLLRADRRGVLRFGALQSPAGRRLSECYGLKADDPDTFYVVDAGRVYDKADAALAIARRLGGIWHATRLFGLLPKALRDRLYDVLARNRLRWFGARDSCRLPSAAEKARFLT